MLWFSDLVNISRGEVAVAGSGRYRKTSSGVTESIVCLCLPKTPTAVISRDLSPLAEFLVGVVRFYNKRGTAEQWIKEGKQVAAMTRLSCHRFRANQSTAMAVAIAPWSFNML
jgi:hypothetical protein